VGDEIPETPESSSINSPVDRANKEINTEKPVNSPEVGLIEKEIVGDVIPETPINPSIINTEKPVKIENKPSIDEKKPEAPGNSLGDKELNKKEMIDNIKNPEKPAIIDKISSIINPEGPNIEIYKANILLGQKILIVMTCEDPYSNIKRLFKNDDNKTVNEAANHFGIELVTVNNYDDAIKEITKEENGKCPYYACWTLNNNEEQSKTKEFLELLSIFWINGGAVVLLSDNNPLIIETNIFLSMISAGFTMDGSYLGKKEIYGDDTGLLQQPALFNRKKEIYKFNGIQRQSLSHNLYNIYEGITISSITKNGERQMNVKLNDIKPFIPFARDSEGGITSFFKLASDKGEGDLIFDGGDTKLFDDMKENGTFRYVQNIIGFTARPEVHLSNNINPKDYRPNKVTRISSEDLNNKLRNIINK
jgi:hypothetical protein